MTTYALFELGSITPSPTNPRKTFDPVKLAELAESIKVSGVHQPILVRPLPGSRIADTVRTITHEIINGERRYRASLLARVPTIPALICEMTDAQVLDAQIVENLQRDDLTDLEEALSYQTLMQATGSNTEQVAAKIGKSTSYVRSKLRLLALCPEAQASLRAGDIDYSRALLLATIPDHQLQIKALGCLAEKNYYGDYHYGVRAAAEFISRTYRLRLDRARFDAASASLLPGAGACNTCHKRTGHDPDLFAQAKSADLCLDPPCYQQKEAAHTAALLAAAHAAGQTVIEGREAKALMPNGWGAVEGYLRLDDVADSPSDKPLRALLGKALEASCQKPTLLANPHKDGELIAMLPAAAVAELLKASEHQKEAQRLESRHTDSKKAEAAAAKTKAKQDYEQAWRDLLLQRTWDEIEEASPETLSIAVLRHVAEHYAQACNGDRAKRLCQLLGLGKVALKEALLDCVRETAHPAALLQLLIMQADVEYQSYMELHYPNRPSNPGLMLVANSYGVDVESVKAECKTATRAKLRKSASPDAQPGKPRKTSAEDAQAQIAKALQQQDGQGEAEPAATDSPADPVQPAMPTVLAEGVRVRVTSDASRLPKRQREWAGKTGTILQKMGDRAWLVSFAKHNNDSMSSFDGSDLTIVPPELPSATPGRPVAYRGPNGETWSGRGLRPKWMTHYLDNGGSIDDIKVVGEHA